MALSCVGMGFLVGALLINLSEEEAFWGLHRLMEDKEMEGMYWSGLPLLQEKIFQLKGLMERHVPGKISLRLARK